MIERPAGAGFARAAELEDFAKQPLAGSAPQKDILARGVAVAVARRDGNAFDAELHGLIEEIGDLARFLAAEQRAIDRYPKALAARETNRGHGLIEYALLANRLIVALPAAVQVNRKCQIRRRAIFVDVFGEQNRVGAQIYKFFARNDAGDDLRHFPVNQRFPAGNGHHRRAAFVDRAQRIFDADALLQDFLRVIDLAASGTGQIVLEQRLQHEHQRVAL